MLEAYAEMLAIFATFFGAAMSLAYIPQDYKIEKIVGLSITQIEYMKRYFIENGLEIKDGTS